VSERARSRGAGRLAVGLALLLVWAVGYTWGTWRYFTRPVPGGNDFMAHYSAWQAYLEHGLNPYSDAAALYTQRAIYGRPALPGEDQNRLNYPFYSILVHGPFVLIGDFALARAIYMTLLQVALFAGVWLMLQALGWRPPFGLLLAILAWSLLNYPEARGVILGQFAIFGFFALAGALWLLARGRDALGGALLVLSTVKPTLVFLVIPFLLLWVASRRRWGFVLSFGVVLACLVLGSLLVLPTWIGDWLNNLRAYPGYTVGQSPVWQLTHVAWPGLGQTGEWLMMALLLAFMLWSWWGALRPGPAGDAFFHWTMGVTLVVSNLIVPRSATTNYVLLLAPTLWIFAALDRLGRPGRLLILTLMLVLFIGQWWLHFATVVGNQEQPVMFLPWPVALGVALLVCGPWLLRESRAAGWWPGTAAGLPLAPNAESSQSR
jgi:hypothetical protein